MRCVPVSTTQRPRTKRKMDPSCNRSNSQSTVLVKRNSQFCFDSPVKLLGTETLKFCAVPTVLSMLLKNATPDAPRNDKCRRLEKPARTAFVKASPTCFYPELVVCTDPVSSQRDPSQRFVHLHTILHTHTVFVHFSQVFFLPQRVEK